MYTEQEKKAPTVDRPESDGYIHFSNELLSQHPVLLKYNGRRIRLAGSRLRRQVYDRGNGICHYCKVSLSLYSYQVDHRLAFSKGGLTVASNLVCTCRPCNLAKGSSDYDEFVNELAEKGLAWRDEIASLQANWYAYQQMLARGKL